MNITTNKVSWGDEIPAELFQILKDNAAKINMLANLENSAMATGLEKVNFHSNPKERQCHTMFKTAQLYSSHTLAKKCSKSPKQDFNRTWIENFQMFKLDSEKAEEPEIKLPTSDGS